MTAIELLSPWKSNISERIKREFFQPVAVTVLLYSGTTGTLIKRLKNEKIDGNNSRNLHADLNLSWKPHLKEEQQYNNSPPISQTILVIRTRHAGHFWGDKDDFISDILLRTYTHGNTSDERPEKIYIHQVSVDTRCPLGDLSIGATVGDVWRETVPGEICAFDTRR